MEVDIKKSNSNGDDLVRVTILNDDGSEYANIDAGGGNLCVDYHPDKVQLLEGVRMG